MAICRSESTLPGTPPLLDVIDGDAMLRNGNIPPLRPHHDADFRPRSRPHCGGDAVSVQSKFHTFER
jgi:hypothetical protein